MRRDRLLPRFLDKTTVPAETTRFDHRPDFAKELIKHKEELIALPRAEGQTASNEELLAHILDEILMATIPPVFKKYYSSWPPAVLSLLSICIPGNRTKPYGELLDLLSRPYEEPFYTIYLGVYAKVIPGLVELLGKSGISLSSSPSREFFCHTIGTYLQEILGSKEGSPFVKFPELTCGHEPCSRVNEFFRSEEKRTTISIGEDPVERCVEDLQVAQRYGLFEWKVNRRKRPPYMELTKTGKVMELQHWSVRLAGARGLLKSIGTDEEISQIMGERYPDVEKALEGSQAFVMAGTQREEAEEVMVGIE